MIDGDIIIIVGKSTSPDQMTSLVITGILFAAIPAVLMVPLVVYIRARKRADSWLLPLCHAPAVATAYVLMAIRFGQPQSLGSIVEYIIIDAVAIVAAYLKVFAVDAKVSRPRVTTLILTLALVGLAFVLRLLMPPLQE